MILTPCCVFKSRQLSVWTSCMKSISQRSRHQHTRPTMGTWCVSPRGQNACSCPGACLVQRRGYPVMATGAWTSNLKIPDAQQKSRVRVCVKDTDSPKVSRVATLFHRSVLTGQPGFLPECGVQVTLVLIFLALRCIRTRYCFWVQGCKLRFQTFGNHGGRFPWNNSSNQGCHSLLTLRALLAFPPCCS